MDLVSLDEQCQLFISPSIDDWKPIEDHGITAVIDLDGNLDLGIPNIPNHMLYVYFPICTRWRGSGLDWWPTARKFWRTVAWVSTGRLWSRDWC
jgi:hypothetical protein